MNTLRLLGGGAVHGLVEASRGWFAAATGHAIEGTFGAVGAMRARLLAGEPADVVVLTRTLIGELAREGHVVAGSGVDIGSVDTAIATRTDDRAPALGDAASLRAALLAADAIHFPDPALATAGIHFAAVLADLGIADVVASRLRTAPNGATAMRALAASTDRRPIGCTQATEILSTPGIVLVAPLPAGHALATIYTAAIATTAQAPEAAARLIALLTAPGERDARRALGFA